MRMIATVQVEITVPDDQQHPEAWAADAIGEAMRELCMDSRSGFTEWAYVETEAGWSHPEPGNLDHTRITPED